MAIAYTRVVLTLPLATVLGGDVTVGVSLERLLSDEFYYCYHGDNSSGIVWQ